MGDAVKRDLSAIPNARLWRWLVMLMPCAELGDLNAIEVALEIGDELNRRIELEDWNVTKH